MAEIALNNDIKLLTDFLENILHFLGINLFTRTNYLKITLLTAAMIITVTLSICNFVLVEELSLSKINNTVETLFTIFHHFCKLWIFVVFKRRMEFMIRNCEKFLQLEQIESEFQNNYEQLLKHLLFVKKFWICYVGLAIFVRVVYPFRGRLSFETYIPEFIGFKFYAAFNTFICCFNCTQLVAADLTSCIIVNLLRAQFKVLNHQFSLIDFKLEHPRIVERNLHDFIEYHSFLYRYVEVMNPMIGTLCFAQYLIFVSSMCFELYISEMSTIVEILTNAVYIVGLFGELTYFYCLPTARLVEEIEATMDVIYASNWHECESQAIIKDLFIIRTRAKYETNITFYGIMTINMRIWLNAIKATISYYTTIKIIGGKIGS